VRIIQLTVGVSSERLDDIEGRAGGSVIAGIEVSTTYYRLSTE